MAFPYLITGARGQLGSEWVRQLQKMGIRFHAFGSNEMDITNAEETEHIISQIKPSVIINTAAYTKVDLAEDEPDKSMLVNAEAVQSLAALAKKYGSLLIHYSTDYVFPGNFEDKSKLMYGYPENYPTDPVNTYGLSKLRGEEAIQKTMSDFLIIRVSWLCGYYRHNFIKTMIRLGQEKDELRVVNDQFGSPTYTSNVVSNTLALINSESTGVYHITSNGLITWYDLTCEIMKKMGYKTKVTPVTSDEYPTKAKRPQFSKLNTQKISTVPGVHLIDWKDGLNNLVGEIRKENG